MVAQTKPATLPGLGHIAEPVNMVTAPKDKKLYRRVTLGNGLRVILIADPEMADQVAGGSESDVDTSNSQAEESSGEEEDDDDEEEEDGEDSHSEASGAGGPPTLVKKAAAAMAVGVGSFKDPAQLQGLSHYLEHMLFMGSEKYPDENEYDAFLAKHGGSSNAFTELEYTNYHFDVKPNALYGALDRFAQFFIHPLCKADALEREVMAVDNEFTGVLQSDSCRLSQLRCHTSHAGHIYNAFSWGNRQSLFDGPQAEGIAVRDRIVQYYREQYSAERMTLVVLGGQTLDELEQWIEELFSAVPNGRGLQPTYFDAGMPYQGGHITISPSVKEAHQVMALFQLPSLTNEYRSKAEDYLSHLVGHEGQGSLLSALKAKGWASELGAGVGDSGYDRNTAAFVFEVHMTLTEAGLAAEQGAGLGPIGVLFQFLNLLKQSGPQKWVFDELADIAQMRFRFAEEEDACEYALRLAADAPYYAPQHLLNGHYLYDDWQPDLVSQLLDHMIPSNVRIDLQTSSFSTEAYPKAEREPWFDVPYVTKPIPTAVLEQWASQAPGSDLALPPKNSFIPTDFTLRCDDTATASTSKPTADLQAASANGSKRQPSKQQSSALAGQKHAHNGTLTNGSPRRQAVTDQGASDAATHASPPDLLCNDAGLRVWHKLDHHFQTPKAAAYFSLTSTAMYESPRAAAVTHLLVKVLEDTLCETAYLADVAGLSYDMCPEGLAGIEIKVDGFSHKLPLLVNFIFKQLVDLKVDPARFERLREGLLRRYKNANMKPDKHATYLRIYAIKKTLWPVEAVQEQIEAVTPADLQEALPKMLSKVCLEALLHGNLTSKEALALAQQAQHTLSQSSSPAAASQSGQLLADQRPVDRILQLPAGQPLLHRVKAKNPEEGNSVVELYVQVGSDDLTTRSLLDMVAQILQEPCYDTLRTKQQLGYSVHSGVRLTHGVLGFAVCVVSGTHSPTTLQQRIESFLDDSQNMLANLPAADFERHRKALIAAKLQQNHSLLDESDRHWEQVQTRRYNFMVRQQEVEKLTALEPQGVSDFYARHVPQASKAARRLAVHVVSNKHAEDMQQATASDLMLLDDFKSKLNMCDAPIRSVL